jgi:hypothetical protein
MFRKKQLMQSDPIIEAHLFARKKLFKDKGDASLAEFIEHMKSLGYDDQNLQYVTFGNIFVNGYATTTSIRDVNDRYSMLPSAYFNLLEYEELRDARKNSREAKSLSLWAIAISACSIVISVLMGVYIAGRTQDVRLETNQLEELKETIRSEQSVNK